MSSVRTLIACLATVALISLPMIGCAVADRPCVDRVTLDVVDDDWDEDTPTFGNIEPLDSRRPCKRPERLTRVQYGDHNDDWDESAPSFQAPWF